MTIQIDPDEKQEDLQNYSSFKSQSKNWSPKNFKVRSLLTILRSEQNNDPWHLLVFYFQSGSEACFKFSYREFIYFQALCKCYTATIQKFTPGKRTIITKLAGQVSCPQLK